MKKLLILTTVAILLSGAAGCRIADWWRRPDYQQQCPPTVIYSSPCTTVSDCSSCGCCAAPGVTTVP